MLGTKRYAKQKPKAEDCTEAVERVCGPAHCITLSSSSSADGLEPNAAMASKSFKISGLGKEEIWETVAKLRAHSVRRAACI